MSYTPENPLIVQSDHTILVETASPHFEAARDALVLFSELIKSPEYVHTWRLTPLSLWNVAAAGHAADEVMVLERLGAPQGLGIGAAGQLIRAAQVSHRG